MSFHVMWSFLLRVSALKNHPRASISWFLELSLKERKKERLRKSGPDNYIFSGVAFWLRSHGYLVEWCVFSVVISVWDSAVNQSAAGGPATPLQKPQSTAAVHSIPDHFQKVLPTMFQRLPNLLCQHDSFSSRTCGYEDSSLPYQGLLN